MFFQWDTLTFLAAIEGTEDEHVREKRRVELRERLVHMDIGINVGDYAISETGSCVLVAKKGVSRVISLLAPIHVAMVESGQVLPDLEDLFALRRLNLLDGDTSSHMDIISGPSRSADIEKP